MLRVNAPHLPGVEGAELGGAALGAQGDAGAVAPSGVDADCDALLAVREDLYHAAVDEYPEPERLVRVEPDRGRLGSAGECAWQG